jgi:hypothetical protein
LNDGRVEVVETSDDRRQKVPEILIEPEIAKATKNVRKLLARNSGEKTAGVVFLHRGEHKIHNR